ncbi:MAG: anion permease, partial [Gemmatimonadota bacterium]|nr:anion permease [Gemmatimonadota bacterium]
MQNNPTQPIDPPEGPPGGQGPPGDHGPGMRRIQWAGFIGGAIAFLLILVLPAPEGLTPTGWRTAAVAVLMAVWWMTEAIPITATALIPLVFFPALGVLEMPDA